MGFWGQVIGRGLDRFLNIIWSVRRDESLELRPHCGNPVPTRVRAGRRNLGPMDNAKAPQTDACGAFRTDDADRTACARAGRATSTHTDERR
jgi:hypothetical protein